jgi:hypothetical protein
LLTIKATDLNHAGFIQEVASRFESSDFDPNPEPVEVRPAGKLG